jgi:hypothetical protein
MYFNIIRHIKFFESLIYTLSTVYCRLSNAVCSVAELCHFDRVPVPVQAPASYFLGMVPVPASVPYIIFGKF